MKPSTQYQEAVNEITSAAAKAFSVRMKYHRALRQFRRSFLAKALEQTKSKTAAAAAIGLHRTDFHRRLAKEKLNGHHGS